MLEYTSHTPGSFLELDPHHVDEFSGSKGREIVSQYFPTVWVISEKRLTSTEKPCAIRNSSKFIIELKEIIKMVKLVNIVMPNDKTLFYAIEEHGKVYLLRNHNIVFFCQTRIFLKSDITFEGSLMRFRPRWSRFWIRKNSYVHLKD